MLIRKYILMLQLIMTLLVVNLAFGLANFIIFDHFWVDGWSYPSLFIIINLVNILAFFITRFYEINPAFSTSEIFNKMTKYLLIIFVLSMTYWLVIFDKKYYFVHLALFFLFFIVLSLINIFIMKKVIRLVFSRLTNPIKAILIKGSGEIGFPKIISQNNWLNLNIEHTIALNEDFESKLKLKLEFNNCQAIIAPYPCDFKSLKLGSVALFYYSTKSNQVRLHPINYSLLGDYFFYPASSLK